MVRLSWAAGDRAGRQNLRRTPSTARPHAAARREGIGVVAGGRSCGIGAWLGALGALGEVAALQACHRPLEACCRTMAPICTLIAVVSFLRPG